MAETSEREGLKGPSALLAHGLLCHGLAPVVQKDTRVVGAGVDGSRVRGAWRGGDLGFDKTEAVVAITTQGVIRDFHLRGLVHNENPRGPVLLAREVVRGDGGFSVYEKGEALAIPLSSYPPFLQDDLGSRVRVGAGFDRPLSGLSFFGHRFYLAAAPVAVPKVDGDGPGDQARVLREPAWVLCDRLGGQEQRPKGGSGAREARW